MLKMMNYFNSIYICVFLIIFLNLNGSIISYKNFQSNFNKHQMINKQLFPNNYLESETEKLLSSSTNFSKYKI
jgi:hypothetical protein